jgi:hypothetical protein
VRRLLRETKNVIFKGYAVYISEDVGKLNDPSSYKEVMMSENSIRWLDGMGDELSSMSSNDV